MNRLRPGWVLAALSVVVGTSTTVARLSLEEIVGRSDLIVTGRVARSWAAWDTEHLYIWTHNEIAVESVTKGGRAEKIVVSEPGGVVNGVGMSITGAPTYAPAEQVMLFLERMPNGYLRTIGLGQGKFQLSADGRLHMMHSGAELVRTGNARSGTALQTLDKMPALQARELVSRLVKSIGSRQ